MLVVRVGVARGVGALELPPLAELPEPRRSLRPRPRFRERPPPKLELVGPFGEFAELALQEREGRERLALVDVLVAEVARDGGDERLRGVRPPDGDITSRS